MTLLSKFTSAGELLRNWRERIPMLAPTPFFGAAAELLGVCYSSLRSRVASTVPTFPHIRRMNDGSLSGASTVPLPGWVTMCRDAWIEIGSVPHRHPKSSIGQRCSRS